MLSQPPQRILKRSSDASSASQAKVKVVLRVRPLQESEQGQKSCVYVKDSTIEIINPRNEQEVLKYKFDTIYDHTAMQQTLYIHDIQHVLEKLFDGINITIFCYGVTGAGKTYTMQGCSEDEGIIPRSARDVFEAIEKKHPKANVEMSYFEIYKDNVFDLLKAKDNRSLSIREDSNRNIIIADLKEVPVRHFEDFNKTYEAGVKNRSTGATQLNRHSSRSHAVLRLKITNNNLVGKLQLIDLAGSEDNRQTGNKKEQLVESSAINKSLFALNQVVDAINGGAHRIPYRNSKLTRTLQDSLGGNSYSVMILNIAPVEKHFYGTYQTLNFASKTREVCNRTIRNEVEPEPKRIKIVNNKPEEKENDGDESTCPLVEEEQQPMIKEIVKMKKDKRKHLHESVMLSPYLRQQKICNETLQNRIEELEKKFTMKEDFTPGTREKIVKKNVQTGIEFEKDGNLKAALAFFKHAMEHEPNSKKLSSKVKKLQDKLNSSLHSTSLSDSKPILKKKKPLAEENQKGNHALDISQLSALSTGKPSTSATSIAASTPDNACIKQKGLQLFNSTPPSGIDDTPGSKIDENFSLSEQELFEMNDCVLALLNQKDKRNIVRLRGIAKKRAEQIVEYIEVHGPLKQLSDLKLLGFTDKLIGNLWKSKDILGLFHQARV